MTARFATFVRAAAAAFRVLAAIGLLALPALAAAGDPPAGRIAATGISLTGGDSGTEIVLDLTGPADVTAGVLMHPSRMTLDLPNVVFKNGAGAGARGVGLVAGYRYGMFTSGSSRIVLDLAAPCRLETVRSEPGPAGTRLILRLAPVTVAAFETAARAGETRHALGPATPGPAGAAPETGTPPAPPAIAGAPALPLVVIDPGHGGIDPGAGSGPEVEKEIVLKFGLMLKEKLEKSGKVRVAMTRDDDTFVSLGGRVKYARDHGAGFFISIHADTLSDGAGVRGATVYTAATRASDARAAQLADKENRADLVAGIESPDEKSDVADILFDLTRRETRHLSNRFAHVLVGTLKRTIITNKNPTRSANFRVLRAYDVPSVLLELGYLSNRHDYALLTSQEWREAATNAVADAIVRYFGEKSSRGRQSEAAPRGDEQL